METFSEGFDDCSCIFVSLGVMISQANLVFPMTVHMSGKVWLRDA